MGFEYVDVRSFRGADCDTDYNLLVVEVRERLAVTEILCD
jgi:hypothetical protein